MGQFSIVNAGSGDATGWRLVAAFPGDQIQFVIGAADAVTGGESLILSPPSAGTVLAPGASLTVVFTAWGLAASPFDLHGSTERRASRSRPARPPVPGPGPPGPGGPGRA